MAEPSPRPPHEGHLPSTPFDTGLGNLPPTMPVPAEMTALQAMPPPFGPRYGRYAIQRFHAKGGLGEVHVALDEELKRNVALKRMQDRCANDPAARRRFLNEAEITARLA